MYACMYVSFPLSHVLISDFHKKSKLKRKG